MIYEINPILRLWWFRIAVMQREKRTPRRALLLRQDGRWPREIPDKNDRDAFGVVQLRFQASHKLFDLGCAIRLCFALYDLVKGHVVVTEVVGAVWGVAKMSAPEADVKRPATIFTIKIYPDAASAVNRAVFFHNGVPANYPRALAALPVVPAQCFTEAVDVVAGRLLQTDDVCAGLEDETKLFLVVVVDLGATMPQVVCHYIQVVDETRASLANRDVEVEGCGCAIIG